MTAREFLNRKKSGEKISMVTCYDYWSARLLQETSIDALLVGDSLAMVMHGYSSTLHATIEMMQTHTAAVARGAPHKFIVADMPFLSYRKDLKTTMDAVQMLMQAGAHAVKLEGVTGHEEHVRHIVESGVPVMGHVGLIPQSIHKFGGFRVQGRETGAAEEIRLEAQRLQDLGCFGIVLECIPTPLALEITELLSIPTIGIGAGPETDGQILVLQDLLGANRDFQPKFLRKYADFSSSLSEAVSRFDEDVKKGFFPNEKESYL